MRWGANAALQAIVRDRDDAIPALAARLTDKRQVGRWAIAALLGDASIRAVSAVPALVRSIDDSDEELGELAMNALISIARSGFAARESLEELARLTDDPATMRAAQRVLATVDARR